jgi:molybdopterin/thiamine biosynthesis adenylyltransferase
MRGFFPESVQTWSDAISYVSEGFHSTGATTLIGESKICDIWAGRVSGETQKSRVKPRIWLLYGNGRALVGNGEMSEIGEFETRDSFLDAPNLVAGSSVLVHRYAMQEGVFLSKKISDCWITMTARVDGMAPEEAAQSFESRFGNATATYTSDGLGSLIRFRVPISETPGSLLWQLESEKIAPAGPLQSPMDVGPLPALSPEGAVSFESQGLPDRLGDVDALVLGAGGLGSWAIPLLMSGCDPETSSLSIIDDDEEVEVHNLNRQVLYRPDDIGKPKATSARKRILECFNLEKRAVQSIQSRLEAHHSYGTPIEEIEDSISIEEITGKRDPIQDQSDERISSALDSMQVALSCLDNQFSRTALNRACHQRGVTMVNGGCEGTSGLVETFSGERCMVCAYGVEEALSIEKISCQEEGARPVSSLVTTSSYVGSMMASMALCELARQRGVGVTMPEPRDIVDGVVSNRVTGSLPWVEGDCDAHL